MKRPSDNLPPPARTDSRVQWIRRGGAGLGLVTLFLWGVRIAADNGLTPISWVILTTAVVFLTAPVVLRVWGNATVAGALIPIGGLATLLSMPFASGGLHSEAVVWVPFAPLIALFFVGRRAAFIAATVAMLGVAAITVVAPLGLSVPAPDWKSRIPIAASAVGAIWFAAYFARLFDHMRERSQQAEHAARVDIERMVSAIPDLVFLLDSGNEIVSANPAAARHAAIERSGAVSALFAGQGRVEVLALLGECRATKQPATAELLGYGGPVSERFEVHMVPVANQHVVVIVRDITEQHQANELKDDFVSMVSHELRTPLTAISASLSLMDGGVVDLSEEARGIVRLAKRNSDRLAVLIDDILDMRRVEAGQLTITAESLSVADSLASCRDENAAFADSFRVTLRVETCDEVLRVTADPARLQQVLTNLVSNAVKYSPTHGEVVVGAEQSGGGVRFTVKDSGPGIPTAFQPRVFERFTQADGSTKRQTGSSGLGLNITKTLVEAMDGEITFVSAAGKGTTFSVWFPTEAASGSS